MFVNIMSSLSLSQRRLEYLIICFSPFNTSANLFLVFIIGTDFACKVITEGLQCRIILLLCKKYFSFNFTFGKKVKKCNKQNLNIFIEPNLFIQHHERNWEENVERMDVGGMLKETVVSRPQWWEDGML